MSFVVPYLGRWLYIISWVEGIQVRILMCHYRLQKQFILPTNNVSVSKGIHF